MKKDRPESNSFNDPISEVIESDRSIEKEEDGLQELVSNLKNDSRLHKLFTADKSKE